MSAITEISDIDRLSREFIAGEWVSLEHYMCHYIVTRDDNRLQSVWDKVKRSTNLYILFKYAVEQKYATLYYLTIEDAGQFKFGIMEYSATQNRHYHILYLAVNYNRFVAKCIDENTVGSYKAPQNSKDIQLFAHVIIAFGKANRLCYDLLTKIDIEAALRVARLYRNDFHACILEHYKEYQERIVRPIDLPTDC
jgi:hypothetical protein